jgi:hypothetical protein
MSTRVEPYRKRLERHIAEFGFRSTDAAHIAERLLSPTFRSVPLLLSAYEDAVEYKWTPETESFSAMMGSEDDRPSGISGIEPAYYFYKAEVIRTGRKVVELMNKAADIAARRGRR